MSLIVSSKNVLKVERRHIKFTSGKDECVFLPLVNGISTGGLISVNYFGNRMYVIAKGKSQYSLHTTRYLLFLVTGLRIQLLNDEKPSHCNADTRDTL